VASFAVDTSMRVSNAKAKAELGWQPAFPTYHDGIRAIASLSQPAHNAGGSP
jgi:nucleoside-diphosphate-sugar epimerase